MHWSRVTDKVEPHGYLPAYQKIAADIGPAGRVVEVGVAGGGSLEMWQHLFPFGVVVGVDNEPERCSWPEGAHQVHLNQDDPRLPGHLLPFSSEFDLIVDDCSHWGEPTARTRELLWPLVAPGGYYVIEDWNGYFQGHDWGAGILTTVQNQLLLLDSRHAECDEITYRWGLCILHKRHQ